jgi:6-phosphogluconolactonase/glucosamine-6-phosphate isomerase/deaminase
MEEASGRKSRYVLGLSGGTTPGPVYEQMMMMLPDMVDSVRMENTRREEGEGKEEEEEEEEEFELVLFMVDERCVVESDEQSNVRMVRKRMLERMPMRMGRVRVRTVFPVVRDGMDAEEVAREYEQALRSAGVIPLSSLSGDDEEEEEEMTVDCCVMGMGSDYHTASLFPPLTDDQMMMMDTSHRHDGRMVEHTVTDKFAVRDRITVTLQFLQRHCRQLLFLLQGKEKVELWHAMRREYEHVWTGLEEGEDDDRGTMRELMRNRPVLSLVHHGPCQVLAFMYE